MRPDTAIPLLLPGEVRDSFQMIAMPPGLQGCRRGICDYALPVCAQLSSTHSGHTALGSTRTACPVNKAESYAVTAVSSS